MTQCVYFFVVNGNVCTLPLVNDTVRVLLVVNFTKDLRHSDYVTSNDRVMTRS